MEGKMSDRPGFIVDPQGNVRDVRNEPARPIPSEGSPPPPASRWMGLKGAPPSQPPPPLHRYVQVNASQPRRSGGLIFIPIGLIITLVITLARCLGGNSQNTYSEAGVNALNFGTHEYAQGNYSMALVEFNQAIDSEPKMAEAFNGRGLTYSALGDEARAIADFTQAITLKQGWSAAYSNRGASYFINGDEELALADFVQAIQLDARNAKAYYNRGLLHQKRNELDAALLDFTKAIELTPEMVYAFRSTLASKGTPGAFNEIMASSNQEMDLTSTYADLPRAYLLRAGVHLAMGAADLAAADLQKALSLGLPSSEALWMQALMDGLQGLPPLDFEETPTMDVFH
jgi:Flp pilus assembly protein TadD